MALVETGAGASPASSWQLQRDGVPFGPYTDIQFRQMMSAGQLLGTDLAWRDGMPQWASLAELYPAYFTPIAAAAEEGWPAAQPEVTNAYSQSPAVRPRPVRRNNNQFAIIATVATVVVVVPLLSYLGYVAFHKEPPKPAAPPPVVKPATKPSIFSE